MCPCVMHFTNTLEWGAVGWGTTWQTWWRRHIGAWLKSGNQGAAVRWEFGADMDEWRENASKDPLRVLD